VATAVAAHQFPLTDTQRKTLEHEYVFFGHQSVGDNVVEGLRDLLAEDPRLHLTIVRSDVPHRTSSPAFVESHIGQNTDPASKDRAFRQIMNSGFGAAGGIALYKYCYVDFGPSTDVARVFDEYRKTIEDLEQQYPALKVVPVTVPVRTVEAAAKAWVKNALGKNTERDNSIKRNDFNAMLRHHFGSRPIFDLAAVESTREDGSRVYFLQNEKTVYTMAPEYTTDGGHLNEIGRRAAARQLLEVLAGME
jgi:hypothetical protein